MKKLLLVAAVAAFTMTSCKKDYTCSCTTTVAGISQTSNTTITATKKDATTTCEAGNQSSNVLGVVSEVKCEIK